MPNHLVETGQKLSVKVAIPADVKHLFGKRAFKQASKTSAKTVAITRPGLLISQFKDATEDEVLDRLVTAQWARNQPELPATNR